MPQVMDVLAKKGSQVLSIGPTATVLDAAAVMNEHKIGALVVTKAERVIGIFTERDVLRRVVAEQRDPGEVRVEDVMSEEVLCCKPGTDLEEVRAIMTARRVRHLPVVEEHDRLVGVISIGDLNAFRVNSQAVTIQYLEQYLYGQV